MNFGDFFKAFIFKTSPTFLSIICLPLIYAVVPIEVIGQFEEILFLSAIVVIFLKLSIPSIYFRAAYENISESIAVVRFYEVWCILVAPFLFLGVYYFTNSLLIGLYFMSCIGLCFLELVRRDVQFRSNYRVGVSIVFASALLLQVLKLFAVWFYASSLEALLGAESVVNFLYLLIYFWYRLVYFRTTDTSKSWYFTYKKYIKYGAELYVHHILSFFYQYSNKLVTVALLSSVDMAILALGLKFVLPFSLIVDAFCFQLMPKIFKGLDDESKILRLSVVVCAVSIFPYFLFANLVLNLVFGSEFSSAGQILPFLLLGVFFNFIYRLSSIRYFYAKEILPVIVSTASPVVVVGLFLWFMKFDISLEFVSLIFCIQAILQTLLIIIFNSTVGRNELFSRSKK